MSAATILPSTTSRTAADLASIAQAATAADFFANTGVEMLYVKNGDGSDHTLTVALAKTYDGLALTAKTYVLTAGHSYLIGPFSPTLYNDASGNVALTYTAITSVTVAVIKPGSP